MAEKLNPAIGYIGNALRSVAKDHITGFSEDTYDEHFQEYQAVLNKLNAIQDEEGNLEKTPFKYILNEEFIFAMVDENDVFLAGIQWDGTPVFGKTSAVEDRLQSQVTLLAEKVATIMGDEDTTNVIDTMNELKKFFAEIENTQTLTSILSNLDKATIKDEEGNVQESPFRVVSNDEFLWAVVDSEDRLLFGIYRESGKPYFPLNEMYHVEQNEEFFAVWLDTDDKVILGIRRDGEIICNVYGLEKIKLDISDLQENLTNLDNIVNYIKNNLIDTDKVKEIINESISEQYPKNKWLPILSNLKRVKTDVSTGLQVTDEATLSLLWLSDVHKRFEAMQHFLYFKEKYKKYIDDAILSGDVVNTRWQDDISSLTSINGYNDILFAIGNHDVSGYNAEESWTVGPNAPLTEAFKKYMRNWEGCIFSSDAEEKGKMYYYKDYGLQKIRLIVLDSNLGNNYFPDIKNEQDNWFETVLSDAKDRGLSVIACMHIPHGGVDSGFDCPFNSMDNEKAKAYSNGVVLNDKVRAFQRNGGDFICWMFGHLHTDFCGTLKLYPKQLFFSIGGALFIDAGNCDSSKIEGTNSEDLFNIISIDNNKKMIRLIRIGNEYDRHCRHRGGIVVDYSNKENIKLISNW